MKESKTENNKAIERNTLRGQTRNQAREVKTLANVQWGEVRQYTPLAPPPLQLPLSTHT